MGLEMRATKITSMSLLVDLELLLLAPELLMLLDMLLVLPIRNYRAINPTFATISGSATSRYVSR